MSSQLTSNKLISETLAKELYQNPNLKLFVKIDEPKPSGGVRPITKVDPSLEDYTTHKKLIKRISKTLAHEFKRHLPSNYFDYSYGVFNKTGYSDISLDMCKAIKQGPKYVIQEDIKKFYDTINRDTLREKLAKALPHRPELIALLFRLLGLPILDIDEKVMYRLKDGLIQGLAFSSALANFYLFEFDIELRQFQNSLVGHGSSATGRYHDDIKAAVYSIPQAEKMKAFLTEQVQENGLIINPKKSELNHFLETKFFCFKVTSKFELTYHQNAILDRLNKLEAYADDYFRFLYEKDAQRFYGQLSTIENELKYTSPIFRDHILQQVSTKTTSIFNATGFKTVNEFYAASLMAVDADNGYTQNGSGLAAMEFSTNWENFINRNNGKERRRYTRKEPLSKLIRT